MQQCTRMFTTPSNRGFTLFETIVATGILITALAGIAQLFVLGAQLTRQASVSGAALLAAQNKLEQLRGAAFGFDAAGNPVTASELELSSAFSLGEDEAPYCDWLDAGGEAHDDQSTAAYVRRWRVTSIGEDPDVIAIEVCVFVAPAEDRGPQSAEACLSTIRTRQP